MTTWYNWEYWCETESTYVYGISETKRTTCPNDPNHTIGSIVTAVETRNQNIVNINQTTMKTGDNAFFSGKRISIPASVGIHEFLFAEPIPMNLFSVTFFANSSHDGDYIEVYKVIDAVIGKITSSVTSTDTLITVEQSVIDNVSVGEFVRLDDLSSENIKDIGRVTNVDDTNNQITVSGASPDDFPVGTLVKKNTLIGIVTTTSVTAGDNIINVSQTVIDNIKLGFFMRIDDGINVNELGRVITIDSVDNRITTTNSTVNSFAIGSGVGITAKIVYKYPLPLETHTHRLGDDTIGAMDINAHDTLCVGYNNKDGVAKTFVFNYSSRY